MSRLERRLNNSLRQHVRTVLVNVPAIREGDVEAVHQARVATRRTRAVLSVIQPAARDGSYDLIRKTIRRLRRDLGEVRDVDVVLELLRDADRGLTTTETAASMYQSLRRERSSALRHLIKDLEAAPLQVLSNGIPLERRSWWSGRASAAAANLRAETREQSRAVKRAAERASDEYSAKRAHNVRVESKRLRYLRFVTTQAYGMRATN